MSKLLRKIIAITSVILGLIVSPLSFAIESQSEEAVKAAFLYHFFNFIEWPNSKNDSYVLCIIDDPKLFTESQNAFSNKQVKGRKIQVVPHDEDACHIRISDSSAASTSNMLTIGALSDGAMLEFVIRDHKVRFVIDSQRIKASALQISSQLLKLAEKT